MNYKHLGGYSDWVSAAQRQQPLFPLASPGEATIERLREVLGFNQHEEAIEVRLERTWQDDGIIGEELSWSVGYGPRTFAWLLKPEAAHEPLPAVVALHDHGGFKYYGKEKIADGPEGVIASLKSFQERGYGGRAFANALAREGLVVLVPDTFLWGSRRFPLNAMPAWVHEATEDARHRWSQTAMSEGVALEIAQYNSAAFFHELLIEKYCALLGTTMAGVVAHEDRIAVNYLASRPDVTSQIGCIGLSGGGNRAAFLQATSQVIQVSVIVGLMSSYEGLLDHNVAGHTWMLFPHGWARQGDWPDIAASRAPLPLLVQYDLEDELFTLEGMKVAHQRLEKHYQEAGRAENYRGEFYPGPHKFDLEMQRSAFDWLRKRLA